LAAYKSFPKEKGMENGPEVLQEGYMYGPNRYKIYQSDVFETQLLGKKAIFIRGEEAGKLFYDGDKFKRGGAMIEPVKATLLGEGGVQHLDGEEHRNRKSIFLDLMSEERVDIWGKLLKKHLLKATQEWMKEDSINFYEESQKVLTRAVCEWAGVPLPEEDVEKRSKQLAITFESPASLSPKHIKGRIGRNKAEDWTEELIKQVRDGELHPEEDTGLYQLAMRKDFNEEFLDADIAAVDLLNVLRPSVALSVYMAFTALTLYQFPESKEKIRDKEPGYLAKFTQEIRRYYPFFPFNIATVRKDFTWKAYLFEEGTSVLFDFYGTNFDPNIWEEAELFNPNRFDDWEESPTDQAQYKLVAQGGGDYRTGHRCPGEWNTVKAIEVVADFLVNDIDYTVPEDQDAGYDMTEMPTKPNSGFIMESVVYNGD